MTKNGWDAPLTAPEAMLKGFLSGCLIAGAIFNPAFGFPVQAILFIIGLIVFIEAEIPTSKSMNGVTVLIFAMVGGLIIFGLSITGNSLIFLAVIVLVVVLLYLRSIITGLHILSK